MSGRMGQYLMTSRQHLRRYPLSRMFFLAIAFHHIPVNTKRSFDSQVIYSNPFAATWAMQFVIIIGGVVKL